MHELRGLPRQCLQASKEGKRRKEKRKAKKVFRVDQGSTFLSELELCKLDALSDQLGVGACGHNPPFLHLHDDIGLWKELHLVRDQHPRSFP
jgi:hypothetical protein